jgi:hypothetical protein
VTRDVHAAIAELKKHPEASVAVEIDGLVVEMRPVLRRTLGDLFREAGRWEGETTEEMTRFFRESREAGGAKMPPEF